MHIYAHGSIFIEFHVQMCKYVQMCMCNVMCTHAHRMAVFEMFSKLCMEFFGGALDFGGVFQETPVFLKVGAPLRPVS